MQTSSPTFHAWRGLAEPISSGVACLCLFWGFLGSTPFSGVHLLPTSLPRACTTPFLRGIQKALAAPWLTGTQAEALSKLPLPILFLSLELPGHRAPLEDRLPEGTAGAPRLALCTLTPPACSLLPAHRWAWSLEAPPGQRPVATVEKHSSRGRGMDQVALLVWF